LAGDASDPAEDMVNYSEQMFQHVSALKRKQMNTENM
jgi:hypothetical protein